MQHPFGGCGVIKREIECTSRGEYCSPTFRGPHSSAPSQNQRFCDGVPVVHFGVPGQEFIIFDWGKFREPHSGFPPPLGKSLVLYHGSIDYPLPAGFVVLKREIVSTSLTWEYCSPSFPSGIPPPLGKSSVLLKCGIYFSSFLIEFESRIEIIERRTVLTERRSRGEEGDSTRTAPVST